MLSLQRTNILPVASACDLFRNHSRAKEPDVPSRAFKHNRIHAIKRQLLILRDKNIMLNVLLQVVIFSPVHQEVQKGDSLNSHLK